MKWDSNVTHRTLLFLSAMTLAACAGTSSDRRGSESAATRTDSSAGAIAGSPGSGSSASSAGTETPAVGAANHEGRIPVLEYHLIGDKNSRWGRSRDDFRNDIELLYERGFRPMTVGQMLARDFSAIP